MKNIMAYNFATILRFSNLTICIMSRKTTLKPLWIFISGHSGHQNMQFAPVVKE